MRHYPRLDRPRAHALFLRRWRECAATTIAIACATGCGSRGFLETDGYAEADAAATPVDAGADAPPSDADTPDAREPSQLEQFFECGLCITQKCSSKIDRCFQDPGCSRMLQCVLTKCLPTGLDLACVEGCASDPLTALKAFEIIQCIAGVCGESCGGGISAIPGLGAD